MQRLTDLEKLDRLDHLIRRRATGTPIQLADRLGISLSTLHEYRAYIHTVLKASTRYNMYIQSYEYDFLPEFYLGFEADRTSHPKSMSMYASSQTPPS